MAFFKSKSGESVACYGGTHCSGTVLAELTEPHFIAKARRNPMFTEVFPEAPVVEVQEFVKPVRKTRKKRAKKK